MSKQSQRGRATLVGRPSVPNLLCYLFADLRHYGLTLDDEQYCLSLTLPQLAEYADEKAALARSTQGGVEQYILWSQISAFVRKNEAVRVPRGSIDPTAAAYSSFLSGERACRRSNKRLTWFRGRQNRAPLAQVLELAALKLQSVLPPVVDVYEDILNHCTFGPGTTTASAEYTQKSLFYKISGHQTVTDGCRGMFLDYLHANPRWVQTHKDVKVSRTDHDRVSFVPKSYKTKRTITIQPSLNIFCQKGIEWALVRVCRRVGITLANQSRNGQVARWASLGSGHCTIDLSNASDSVSIELLRWLLPRDWFELLMSARSPSHLDPVTKVVTPTAKFAGMGNATTFPVESLVFWAILQACRDTCGDKSDWRVYGDDIICHKSVALMLVEALRFAGFKTNTSKSFFHGSFFESCGYDFLGGLKVTPVYIRRQLSTPSDVYNLYNRLLDHSFFTFPRTLGYLESLVLNPHRGPWHQSRQELGWWQEGFNPALDAYFISEPPDRREWDPDTQSYLYSYTKLVQAYRKLTGVNKQILYSLFLLGERVDQSRSSISDLGQPIIRSQKDVCSNWPSLKEVLNAKERRQRDGMLTHSSVLDVADLNRAISSRIYSACGWDQESLVV